MPTSQARRPRASDSVERGFATTLAEVAANLIDVLWLEPTVISPLVGSPPDGVRTFPEFLAQCTLKHLVRLCHGKRLADPEIVGAPFRSEIFLTREEFIKSFCLEILTGLYLNRGHHLVTDNNIGHGIDRGEANRTMA